MRQAFGDKTLSLPLCRSLLAIAVSVALSVPVGAMAEEIDAADNAAQTTAKSSSSAGAKSPWLSEAITVTAKGTVADVPSALATDVLDWQNAVGQPSDFQDLITRVPGIGATGQNGIFETFSIRGSGGNGILVLVGGMPVTAQRRAGVPVAFVEPSLLGQINVTRGPATVHFGPGALGGAISIEPRWFDGYTAGASYASSGDEASVLAGLGNDSFSLGYARHLAGDTQAPNGRALNTSYERDSASLQFRTRIESFEMDALLMPSRTVNIGKSNSRYPTRDTTYPEDEHTLGRLRLRHDNGFEASVHGHQQSLVTYNQRPGSADTYANIQSTDMGGTVQQTFTNGDFSHNIGVEFLGRRDVTGFDARSRLNNRTYSLRDAKEDNWSLFALTDWAASDQFSVELGARFSWQDQRQGGADPSDSDQAFTAGFAWTPDDANRWTLNLASGYRFATLEERFFTGVTAQGEIIGNPNLSAEHSLGVDLGYAWQSGDWGVDAHVWHTKVDDLIQLFAVQAGVNGYTNIGKAKLHGAEAALSWTPSSNFSLRASSTLVRSKDELTGNPLYGSPPLTATLEARYDFSRATLGAFYNHRWHMNRPGFEEVERSAVDVVDLDLRFHVTSSVDLTLYLRNAFDENYFATADELSTFAPERSAGISVMWTGH